MIALKCEHIFFYSSPYLKGSTPYSFLKNLANCLGDIPTRYATSLTVKPSCWIKNKPWRHHDTLQLGVVEDSSHNLLSPLHFHCYPFLGWHILVRGTDLQQELRQVTRSRLQFLHTIIQPTEAYQLIHVIEQRLGISVYHLQLFLSPRETASTGWPLLTGTDFKALNAATKSEQTIKDCRQIVPSDNVKLPPSLTYFRKRMAGAFSNLSIPRFSIHRWFACHYRSWHQP